MLWSAISIVDEPVTNAQKVALYRCGRSKWYIRRYCPTKEAARLALTSALNEIAQLKKRETTDPSVNNPVSHTE